MASPESSVQNSAPSPSSSAANPAPPPPRLPAAAEFKVYRPPSNTVVAPLPALPDDYFTPTAGDLRAAQAMLSARTNALVNAPLQIRAAREAVEKAKRDRWPETRIRVKFPDQTQLEKTFPSTDKIRSVYAFVRGCLNDEAKPIKFILYQSPPRRDLKVSDVTVRDLTLSQLQLSPSSILLLRFEDESLNHDQAPAPLLASILGQAIELPVPSTTTQPPAPKAPMPAQPQSSSSSSTPAAGARNTSKEKKILNLLKLGKK